MRRPTFTERKPPPTGVVIGPFSADAVVADRIEDVVRKRVAAVLVHHVRARVADVPIEGDAGRLEHAAGGLRQLWAGAVAGDQGDPVRRHGGG